MRDAAVLLPVAVKREAGLDQRIVIQFQSTDGTAKAGEDYESVKGALIFEPGESSKTVSVTILPDLRQSKGERHFSLVLDNVVGSPKHVVFIQERQVDRSVELQASQMVRAASVVAKDIADHVVRVRVITNLMSTDRRDGATFHQYQKAQEVAQGNLNRARESYAQFFRDMQAMQPRAVLQAMDKVLLNTAIDALGTGATNSSAHTAAFKAAMDAPRTSPGEFSPYQLIRFRQLAQSAYIEATTQTDANKIKSALDTIEAACSLTPAERLRSPSFLAGIANSYKLTDGGWSGRQSDAKGYWVGGTYRQQLARRRTAYESKIFAVITQFRNTVQKVIYL